MKTAINSTLVTIAHVCGLVFLRSTMTGNWIERLWEPLVIVPMAISLTLLIACANLAENFGDEYGGHGTTWAFTVTMSYLGVLLSELPFGWVDPAKRSGWTWFQVAGVGSVAIFAVTSLYFIARNGWLDYRKSRTSQQ